MRSNRVRSSSGSSEHSVGRPSTAWSETPPSTMQVTTAPVRRDREIVNVAVAKGKGSDDISMTSSASSDSTAMRFGWETIVMVFKYVLADFRRHKRSFLIGIFTVMIVVFFTTLLQNSILNVPLIFMRLAEEEIGETDILLTPQFADGGEFFFNFSAVKTQLDRSPELAGAVPRFTFFANVWNPSNPEVNISTTLILMDTQAEFDLDLGRAFNKMSRPIRDQETWVSGPLLRQLGIVPNAGEKIHISYGFNDLIDGVLGGLGGGVDLGGLLGGAGLDVAGFDIVGGTLNLTLEQRETIAESLTDAIVTDQFVNNTQENFNDTVTVELDSFDIGDVFRISVPANITIEPQDPAGVTENNLNNLIYDAVLDAIPETIDINNGSINGTNSTLTSLTIDEDYFVVHGVEDPVGKWPRALGNVVVIDIRHVAKAWSRSIEKSLVDSNVYGLLRLAGSSADDFRGLADDIDFTG
mmetsp:Transcript_35163/g.91222  ORF Transcript_35163/g.91222 Transcript_35163/m.91222 type:complete len:468 (-) Transcript_35163:1834-3237(-)